MPILDAYGRPMQPREMLEPLAEPSLTSIRQAFPGSVASGLTPARLGSILRSADDGDIEAFMILAQEMEEREAHYASVLGQRKRAISGVAPTVEAASEDAQDQKVADWVRDQIAERDDFADLVEDLLDAVGKGFSVVEVMWRRTASEWTPDRFVWRPQWFFQFDGDSGTELRLRDEADPVNGLPIAPGKFLCHRAKLKSGHVFRGGVARVAAFSWMFKQFALKDWMAFIETYGLPLRIGRYGPQATKADVAKLVQAVASIGTDAAAVLPKFMDIEFVDNKSGNGSQPIFENLARYVDEQISKVVLGQTMTTDNGSSMAQAEVHNEVRHDVADADARSITGTINRDLVVPAVRMNFGDVPADRMPKLLITVEPPEDVKARVEAIVALAGAGVRFRAAEARAIVKMEDPERDDETFGGAAAETPPATAREVLATARDIPDGGADELDEIEAEMLAEWEQDLGPLIEPVVAAIEAADSYEDALRRIAALPGAKTGPLIDRLVNGMFKARSLGDVQDG